MLWVIIAASRGLPWIGLKAGQSKPLHSFNQCSAQSLWHEKSATL